MQKYFLIFFMALAVFTAPVLALESPFKSADYVQGRLISGVSATGGQAQIPAGLELRLAENWHAYWRMPGDGGLPPVLNWEGSENVEKVEIQWPLPRRFETYGLYSFGYADSVLLPLTVTLEEPGRPAELNMQGDIMVCEEICVPQKLQLALAIPKGPAEQSRFAPLLERAQEKVPHQGDRPGLKIENMVAGPDAIVVTAFSQAGFEDADLFVESGDLYITAKPEITPDENDPRKAMIRVSAPEDIENLMEYVTGNDITLTLTSGREAIEKTIRF